MKKKEIIIIISILCLTIFLGFLPKIVSCSPSVEEKQTEETPSVITITINGEVNKSNLSIQIPYGYSYGYIISKIRPYLTDYSIIGNLDTRYYKNTTITIESSDISCNETIDYSNKIRINTASQAELTSLYGIGEKRALKIIEYRNNKTITSYEELKSIIGVSDEVMEIIKEKTIL